MPPFLHGILLRSHHHLLDSLEVHRKLVVAIGSRFQCDSHRTKHSSPKRRICSPSYIAAFRFWSAAWKPWLDTEISLILSHAFGLLLNLVSFPVFGPIYPFWRC